MIDMITSVGLLITIHTIICAVAQYIAKVFALKGVSRSLCFLRFVTAFNGTKILWNRKQLAQIPVIIKIYDLQETSYFRLVSIPVYERQRTLGNFWTLESKATTVTTYSRVRYTRVGRTLE